jgi:hypothetical protein
MDGRCRDGMDWDGRKPVSAALRRLLIDLVGLRGAVRVVCG